MLQILLVVLATCFFQLVGAEVHGGTLLAMKGNGCVLVASDSRFATHKTGGLLIGKHNRIVLKVGSKTLVSCLGLDSDARSLEEKLRSKVCSHDDMDLEPHSIARCVSDILYSSPMYCTPTIVGIDSNKMPFICSMDGLGAQTVSNGFAVSGSANTGLYAACEELYRPGMSQQELIALAKRIMTLALQRDVMSGCVCTIHVLNCDGTLRRSEFETDDCF